MPSPISGVVGITISRKRHAISCVRPVAPNSVRIGESSGRVARLSTIVIAAM